MKNILTTALSFLSLAILGHGAALPFTENFDSYNNTANPGITPIGFSENAASEWSIQDDGAGNDYQHAVNEVNTSPSTIRRNLYSATVPITNAAGSDFTISARMTIDAASASSSSPNNFLVTGLNFLGSVGFSPGYTAEIIIIGAGISGTMRIAEDDNVLASGAFSGGLALGVPYTLTLTATYAGASNLTMNFTLSDGTHSSTISFMDTTPRTGQLFGFRDVIGTSPQSSTSLNVDYDNLTIVPEPSAAVTLAGGLALLLMPRRNPARSARGTASR